MNAPSKPNDRYLRSLSTLLAGGLWTDEANDGLATEQAALYIAGAQAKALLMALEWEDAHQQGPDGWGHSHRWQEHDTIAMLSGLVAFLQGARVAIPELRYRKELRDSASAPLEGDES